MTILFLFAAVSVVALGQVQAGFSPVPLWSDARIDKSSPSDSEFVFLDLKTGEYVVQFPGSLSSDPANNGKIIRFRIELQNLGEGSIRSAVKRVSAGYEYSYEIANGLTARRPISLVQIVGASSDDYATLSHPQWMGSRASPTLPSVAPQASLIDPSLTKRSALMGRYLFWSVAGKGSPIGAGSSSSGFVVRSDHRPGWTSVYYGAGRGIALPGVADSMPSKVVERLEELQRAENFYTRGITIGPKFGANVGHHAIAADWLYGLEIMTGRGLINPEGKYTSQLLALLHRTVDAPSDSIPSMTLNQAPESAIEKEIDAAIRVALPIR